MTFARRSGLTLVELLLAVGLLAVLMLAVFQLFDRSLSVWRRGETRRALQELASTVLAGMTEDLRGLEGGERGDVLIEWVRFDTDADGVAETKWPRLRLVRQASAAEVARAVRNLSEPKDAGAALPDEPARIAPGSPGLLEVVWMVAPASLVSPDARSEGVIWRGERPAADATTRSFFARDFFGASNRPPAGATEEVSGGCLWMGILCAAQTSIVNEGWTIGRAPEHAATSWDARGEARPGHDVHPWNEAHVGMPRFKGRAHLPRRVRIELEFERPVDRIRRTRITQGIDNQDTQLRVDDGRRLPTEPRSHVLIDAEWMRVVAVDGERLVVERAQRGTTAVPHVAGALVHWGERIVGEVPVANYREDWNL